LSDSTNIKQIVSNSKQNNSFLEINLCPLSFGPTQYLTPNIQWKQCSVNIEVNKTNVT